MANVPETHSTVNCKSIHALARGLEVIQALNERPATTLASLSQRTGIPKSTLLRILKTLIAREWVYRYRTDSRYRLTSQVCDLGRHVMTVDCIAEAAGPVLDQLHKAVGWPSDIAVCNGYGMRVLDSTRRLRSRMDVHNPLDGHFHMLWSALGRAYLAFCPADEREVILDRLRRSPDPLDQAGQNRSWVENLLGETRGRGYAVAEPGYCKRHLNCQHGLETIALPVQAGGHVQACINLIWIGGRDGSGRVHELWLPALRAAARRIGDALHRRAEQDAA